MNQKPSYPVAGDDTVQQWLKTLDDGQREHFEERAAILEFEGNLPRLDAERLAAVLTRQHYSTLTPKLPPSLPGDTQTVPLDLSALTGNVPDA